MFWTVILNLIVILGFGLNRQPALVFIDGRLVTLKPEAGVTKLAAEKGALLVASDHFFVFTQRADEIQAIASISKLMTAIVFLENNPGWDQVYKINQTDNVLGGKINLFLGDRVTVKDLFYSSLVASDNGATMALVHATGMSEAEFVKKMNSRARDLGLISTYFKEPTGLSNSNVSTAREVALLAQTAFSRKEIRQATTMAEYNFITLDGRAKKIESTDYLLLDTTSSAIKVLAGKTGYTESAGYCFVGLLQGSSGPEVISVVLNSSSKNERFLESEQLVNWARNSYNWDKIN
ncbi:MAG: serine hydrolase [Patescibacteria group bacterium]|jgi:D-alanyl-D-alanine carboxypeptidase